MQDDRNSRSLYIGRGLPDTVTRDDISNFFTGFGKIIDVRMRGGSTFVEFSTSEEARRAKEGVTDVLGYNVVVDFPKASVRDGSRMLSDRPHIRRDGHTGGEYDGPARTEMKRPSLLHSEVQAHTSARYNYVISNLPPSMCNVVSLKKYLLSQNISLRYTIYAQTTDYAYIGTNDEAARTGIEKLHNTEVESCRIIITINRGGPKQAPFECRPSNREGLREPRYAYRESAPRQHGEPSADFAPPPTKDNDGAEYIGTE